MSVARSYQMAVSNMCDYLATPTNYVHNSSSGGFQISCDRGGCGLLFDGDVMVM